ncbi:hypothetical protein EJ05DRAFT_384864 [Pseudovirgaria hyperparasitica]|uniref:Uncharacterized protein n=1 Tax=Pseudovirgaria hyperparasitica TaxID=470096 RepID=A0A6A6W876_9PEZI|nr:uncharacterized protein EJ05DRAFT_384864 [Pseudovirgaria hyperparasitica]KAF2757281.1 hypothetical protein EJ05DRAFT_384864 [Pseudovirgaria hyperparasitica]
MSKLSNSLKQLINAPFARPNTTPAPQDIGALYNSIGKHATSKKVPPATWLTLTGSATFTLNSPASLTTLYNTYTSHHKRERISAAELMREVGLKCIGLNGVPRTINCLNAFHPNLPEDVKAGLTRTPSRTPSADNIEATKRRGRALWDSIYRPFEGKLIDKLASTHPDLPVHIVNSEYGLLFSDPPRDDVPGRGVGRIGMSVVAVACLRAQTGVGPQVLSHIYGLRKSLDDGSWDDGTVSEEGARWLASDEGGEWMLGSVDAIVEKVSSGEGGTFAKAKL